MALSADVDTAGAIAFRRRRLLGAVQHLSQST